MNFADIFDTAGDVISFFNPPAGAALKAVIQGVNQFLPNDSKLSEDANPDSVLSAVNKLSSADQLLLMTKKLDLQIVESNNWAQNVRVLAEVDATGQSTRPFIAMLMGWAVFSCVMTFNVGVFFFAYNTGALPSWEQITAALAVPSILLRAYFGLLTKESEAKLNSANGMYSGKNAGNKLLDSVKNIL